MPNVRDSHGRGFLLPTQDAYTRIETCLSRLPTGVDTAPLTSNPELSNKGLSLDGGFLQLPPPFCYQRDSLSSYRAWLKCDAMKTQHFKYRAALGTVAANTVNSTLPIDLQSDVSHLHSFICHTARCCSAGSLSYLFKAPVKVHYEHQFQTGLPTIHPLTAPKSRSLGGGGWGGEHQTET